MSAIVVAPAYNEEDNIGEVVRSVLALDVIDGMIVVDDHSSDDTLGVAESAGARVVRHEDNRGVGAAIRSGILAAREAGADVVAVISGDNQHIATDLVPMVEAVASGACDLAQGSRFTKGGSVVGSNTFRTSLIRMYSVAFSAATRVRLADATNGLRAFRTSMLDDPRIDLDQAWLEGYELEPYLLYSAAVNGYRVREFRGTVVYPEGRSYTHMRPVVDWWKLFRPLVYLRTGLRS